MPSSRRRSYSDEHAWRDLQPLLPETVRLTDDTLPRESWLDLGWADVHLDVYGDPTTAPATLVLVHGGGGNGRLLAPLGRIAAEHGYAAVAPDLPGYGLTTVASKRRLSFDDWGTALDACVRDVAATSRGPVVLLGLSMGGMLAYDAAARTRLPAAVIASCFLDPGAPGVQQQLVRRPWMARFTGLVARLRAVTDHAPVPMALVSNMAGISNDPAVSRALSKDRLAGGNWMPGRWLRTYLASGPAVPPEEFDVCPVVLAHPADDRWTDVAISAPFLERITKVPTRLVMLENAGHMPIEEPGRTQLQETVLAVVAEAVSGPAAP